MVITGVNSTETVTKSEFQNTATELAAEAKKYSAIAMTTLEKTGDAKEIRPKEFNIGNEQDHIRKCFAGANKDKTESSIPLSVNYVVAPVA